MLSYETFQGILPPSLLSELAIEYQVDAVNQIRLPGVSVFTCLLHGLLHHPTLTQRLLEETYEQRTGHSADHSSFGKRLERISPSFFAGIYQYLQQSLHSQTTVGQERALRLRFVDATVVTLSAKLISLGLLQRTSNPHRSLRQIKSVFEYNQEGFPDLLRVCREPSEKSDCVALGESMLSVAKAGDLFVFDKGCHDRKRLLALHQKGAFFLTPHSQQALRTLQTLPLPPLPPPSAAPSPHEPTYQLCQVQQVTFGNAQETKREQTQWNQMPLLLISGYRWDGRGRSWKPMHLLTNLPLSSDAQQAGPYPFEQIAALYRERWNIELFFKFLKQHLSFTHLISRNENGIQVMLYMTLILAWLLIWYHKQTNINRGWRSVKAWLAHDMLQWIQHTLRNITLNTKQKPKPSNST